MDEIIDKMLQMLADHEIPYKHINHDVSIYKKALDQAVKLGLVSNEINRHIVTYTLLPAGRARLDAKRPPPTTEVISDKGEDEFVS
jgi:hypothetical protein